MIPCVQCTLVALCGGASALCVALGEYLEEFAHRTCYLNNFSRKWYTFAALLNTVPRWRLLGEVL